MLVAPQNSARHARATIAAAGQTIQRRPAGALAAGTGACESGMAIPFIPRLSLNYLSSCTPARDSAAFGGKSGAVQQVVTKTGAIDEPSRHCDPPRPANPH